MNTIKSQDFQNAIDALTKNGAGTIYQEVSRMNDGKTLYLVFGYEEGYEKGEKYQVQEEKTLWTLCAKLAFNVSSLQCDYDVDWYMPYNKCGDIYDTNSALTDNFKSLADYYNHEAKEITQLYNNGEINID